MDKHPIDELMETTMSRLREMIDVNTIVGTPVTTADGVTLIPVSKVSFGFASGGSDFASKHQKENDKNAFGGGSGAGVTINPVAFVVVKDQNIRMLSVEGSAPDPISKLLDNLPDIVDKIRELIPKKKEDQE